MPDIGKLIGLFAVGHQLMGGFVFRRFLSGMAVAAMLAVTLGLLLGALLLGGLYGGYVLLLQQGLQPVGALLATAAAAALIAVILILLTLNYLRRIFDVSRAAHGVECSLSAHVMPIADAFVDGLLTRPAPPARGENPVDS